MTSGIGTHLGADLLLLLQNETLVLCALESEGDGHIPGQTQAWEISRQGAPHAELCFTINLDKHIIHQ